MDLLGNTFEMIAGEKAGIIKRNIPVVISETQPDTQNVFISKARESDSAIYFADKNFLCDLGKYAKPDEGRRYTMTDLSTYRKIEGEILLGGDYQSKNLQAVFNAFDVMKDLFEVSDKVLTEGICKTILNTGLYGRWQILSTSPLTICDTGHNKEGLEYVLYQLKSIPKSELHIVLGFVNDKDLKSVLPLFPADAQYYFTKASVPRALNEVNLKLEAEKYGLKGDSFSDVATAFKTATKMAKQSDVIFIGGSTFIVAEVV